MSFSLTAATNQALAPFCLGYAFRQGDIPAGSAIAASIPEFQAVIKNRWPDGSAKIAVLSGRATLTGGQWLTVNLSSGSAAGGTALTEQDLSATGIAASIQFGSFGVVQLQSLIGVASTYNAGARRWTAGRVREWISGTEMSSWIYYAPIGSDAHLAAWFEVRLWRGGLVEVLPWIENGYLNVAGPTGKSGVATFVLGGQSRYSGTINFTHHSRAVLASGTTYSHWLGADPRVSARHDTTYMQATKLVPSFYGKTAANSTVWSRMPTSYTPLAQAGYPDYMGAGGYDPSIGLIAEWDATYLTSGADTRAWGSVVVHGYAAGRYGLHYRDETTNRPLRYSSYPNLVLNDPNSGVSDVGASTTNSYTPNNGGATPPNWGASHHPSVGFMAYLMTGRNYFLEQLQFSATLTCFLKVSDNSRQGSKGIMWTTDGAYTTRGVAWALRTLVQAITATPDDDASMRSDLIASVEENINRYHAVYIAQSNNPHGVCEPFSDYTPGDGKYMTASWMEDFFTAAWGYMVELAVPVSATAKSKATEFFMWKARSIVGRLGRPNVATEYNFRDAAPYTFAVARSDNANWSNGSGPWYSNWGEIYQATMGQANSGSTGTSLRDAYFPDPTSYWGNLQPAIAYAVDLGVPDALAGYQRMSTASNWNEILTNWNNDPVWGVRPRTA